MANTLHFCGVKSAYPVVQKRFSHCQGPAWQRLEFARRVNWSSRLCGRVKSSSKRRGFQVSCERATVDVIDREETENLNYGEKEEQFTCVMKFGGSSLASAKRMREIAKLILSFPNERPVVVLSAMGKTTNNLLLV